MSRYARVRPLLQIAPADCGPACLRMVLGHFGRHVYARELSREPLSMRDGVTAAWLVACAQRQGLHAEGFEVTVDQVVALPKPAILHTKSSHFVVLEGQVRGRVAIVDPSVGERWYLTEDEARDLLSGVALAFQPAAEFQRRSRFRLLLKALSPVLALDRRTSALVATTGVVLTAVSFAIGTGWLWSSVLGGPHRLLPTLTILDRLTILGVVLALCILPLMGLIDTSVGSQVSTHLARLGGGRLPDERGGNAPPDGSTGVVSYFGSIDPLTTATFPAVSRIILAASALLGAAITSWSTGGSLSILLAAFAVALVTSVVAARLTSDRAPRLARLRAFRAQAVRCAHVLVCLTIWLGAFHLDGALPHPQTRLAFAGGVHLIIPQVLLAVATFRIGGVVALGVEWLARYERLCEGLPDEAPRSGGIIPDATRSADASAGRLPDVPLLRLRGVTLRLGDLRDRLLSELDIDLDEGEHVAFVGPAGAGKTTLARAILGRFNVSPGTIVYCGRSLHEYRHSEREQLVRGIVQGDRMPDTTISRFLRAGNRDASLSQLRAVCAQLSFDEDFSGLPLGYDTPVFFDGDTLSRSQRQMLLLAQAVASGARILVLDDPVNSLDDIAARRVLARLATLPAAVVLMMASGSALCDLNFRVIRLEGGALRRIPR